MKLAPGLVLLAWLPLAGCGPSLEARTPCNSDEDCFEGTICRGGLCEAHGIGLLPVGGDAGPREAGPVDPPQADPDAGTAEDAGEDAGRSDTERDGGGPDAGAADAGADAGPPGLDAGHLDAGLVDAGPPGPAWWDPAWRARRMLRFQNAFQEDDLERFPALVVLDDDVVDLTRIAEGGRDLRFVDADGATVLPYEIERFDASGGAVVWVQVPRIDARSTLDHIWVYYDNPAAPDAQDPEALWSDYALVLHGPSAAGGLPDSSASGHDALTAGTVQAAGLAGDAVALDGELQAVEVPSMGAERFPQERGTVTMWVKGELGAQGESDNLFDRWSAERDHLFLRARGGGELQAVAQLVGDTYAGHDIRYGWHSAGSWHLVGLSYEVENQRIRLFVDASGHSYVPLSPAWSPAGQEVVFGRGFAGAFDEMRVSTRVRYGSWMRAEFLSGRRRFLIYDAPAAPPPAPPRSLSRVPGPVVLYDFGEGQGASVADTSGFGAPLPLSILDPQRVQWIEGGLRFVEPTIAASEPAEKVVTAVQESGAVTIEAWVMPDNPLLDGPARIVTLSYNTGERAFTLGQDPDGAQSGHYNLRFRTSTTSSGNGTDNDAPGASSSMPRTSWGSLDSAAPQHVVFTRDVAGNVVSYVNGVEVESFTWPGDLSVWSPTWRLGLGNEFDSGGGTAYLSRPWVGTLYLVAVYPRALTEPEVQQNYAAGP